MVVQRLVCRVHGEDVSVAVAGLRVQGALLEDVLLASELSLGPSHLEEMVNMRLATVAPVAEALVAQNEQARSTLRAELDETREGNAIARGREEQPPLAPLLAR